MESHHGTSRRRAVAAPNPDVLAAAAARLEALGVVAAGSRLEWEVVRRFDRRRSVVFQVRAAVAGTAAVDAYYKSDIGRPHETTPNEVRKQTISDGLEIAAELTDGLIDLARDRRIGAARVLATDPATQTIVTAAVAGRPLGKSKMPPLSRTERARTRSLFTAVGEAARLIEEAAREAASGVAPAPAVMWDLIEWRLEASHAAIGPRLATRVESSLKALSADLSRDDAVYVHGDFSRGNILVDGDKINMIDFRWVPRLRSFDVSHIAYRIDYDLPFPDPWRTQLVRAVLDGYGQPDLTTSAPWRINRIQHLLGITSRRARRGDFLRKRRARSELARLASL